MSDDRQQPRKFRLAEGTIVGAGNYLVIDASLWSRASNSFSLGAEGGEIYLFAANRAGEFMGYSHGFAYSASDTGVTLGRHVQSTGVEELVAQSVPSLGQTNGAPRIGPIVINEIMYHPPTRDDEFIELLNITDEAVLLFDPVTLTNTWRIEGLGFAFPTNLALKPHNVMLLVATQPDTFRIRHGVSSNITILGPYTDLLPDSGARLRLQRPAPDYPAVYVDTDVVTYQDRPPWPALPRGNGPALQRRGDSVYGNDPINWKAAAPTPGRPSAGVPPLHITRFPVDVSVVATREALFSIEAESPEPIFYQWRFNGSPIPRATNSTLFLTDLQRWNAGNYAVIVFNGGGVLESGAAVLTILEPAHITVQPASQAVRMPISVAGS